VSNLLFEELDDSRVKLFSRVLVAQFHAESVELVRLLLVAPVLFQFCLPVPVLSARMCRMYGVHVMAELLSLFKKL